MFRLRWFVRLFGVVVLGAICLNLFTSQRSPATEYPADLLKRIATLEARVAMLEGQLAGTPRATRHAEVPSPVASRYWSKREFNGTPVYIVPLGHAESKH